MYYNIHVLRTSVAYGGDCSGGGSCDDVDTECISDVCACVTTHFRNNAYDACNVSKYFGTHWVEAF